MIGWLRRNRSDDPGGTGWSADPAPTPEERRDELLSAYLDDDLTAAERAEIDARLETDAEFSDALEGMRTVRDALATLELVRAPRSFAITAPPAPARRGFSPVDLVTRVGAMAAAVAFVAVLVGDLSDSGGPPIVQNDAATSLTIEASGAAGDAGAADAGGGGAAEFAATDPEATSPTPDGAADSAASAPAAEDSAAPAPTEVPVLDEEAPVQAAAATAARSATEQPSGSAPADAVDPPPADGSDPPADDAGNDLQTPLPPNTGGATDPPADATPEAAVEEDAGASADPSSDPVELPQLPATDDVERVDDADVAGTTVAESALGTQSDETVAATANADGANGLAEDGREVSSLAIGLGAAAAALAAVSGLLWWRRRAGTASPG